MRAEWGCSLEQAVYRESLTAALALWPSLLARHGAEIHFDHGDQARQEGKAAMKAWLDRHFTVDPKIIPPADWMTRPFKIPDGVPAPPFGVATLAR